MSAEPVVHPFFVKFPYAIQADAAAGAEPPTLFSTEHYVWAAPAGVADGPVADGRVTVGGVVYTVDVPDENRWCHLYLPEHAGLSPWALVAREGGAA